MLVQLRKSETLPSLAAGFSVSASTVWRYVDAALTGLGKVDGILIPIDQIAAVLLDEAPQARHECASHRPPDGTPPWFSRATLGRTHNLAVSRAYGILQACLIREILVLVDRAYQGAGITVRNPYKNHREQPEDYQQFNRDHARLRAPGERAFAQLKPSRILHRARCCTRRTGIIVQAVHTPLTCSYAG
ncbi:IS5 family transposase [Streptomyces roseolilacinus]|uniref:IS5 family transposase n=1 Tax=Streptomyces roseolilacinus TaxID=66904 RepID=A0A918EPG8_9ACTN|nr:IS5 family transposase [Streptomyces roseolilacinus]